MSTARAEHETRDVNWNAVLRWSIGLLVLMLAVSVSMIGWFQILRRQHAQSPDSAQPAMDEEVVQQLQSLRKSEEQSLNGYAWVSQEDGIARIPIDRAMQWLAQEQAKMKQGENAEASP